MSSNYCVQLKQNILLVSMTTTNPINFSCLQFSLNANSLVIFLFSKYPFNLGTGHEFCVNQDEFGFAQFGQNFNINLTNYQGYYMLILINTNAIGYFNIISNCDAISVSSPFIMTFQNTTITPVQNLTVNSNFDGQYETGFCPGYDIQSTTLGTTCNSPNFVSAISLNSLNNQLVIMSCQAFYPTSNTTVEFAIPISCDYFGAYLTAEIVFSANQQVIDFLNNENASYSILSLTECPIVSPPECTTSYRQIPCKSFFQILKLLSPPTKYSIISSKLWNEIVQDLYLAYSVYKYINYLMQYPYPENIYPAILDFYNFYENFEPYPFTSLLKAQKGIPLTANDFNKLIDAIVKLANENDIKLQKQLNKVQHDQIVKASQFSNIVYDVNQFLTFNHNQYFLISCTGKEFNNLLNLINTFLNVLILSPQLIVTIPNNAYIKNFLIYNNSSTIFIYGAIDKFILNSNIGIIYLLDFSSINSFILNDNPGSITIESGSNINNLQINQNTNSITVENNAMINTLKIQNNSGIINILDNAIVENLICNQNAGTVNISSTATVINNQCA